MPSRRLLSAIQRTLHPTGDPSHVVLEVEVKQVFGTLSTPQQVVARGSREFDAVDDALAAVAQQFLQRANQADPSLL